MVWHFSYFIYKKGKYTIYIFKMPNFFSNLIFKIIMS